MGWNRFVEATSHIILDDLKVPGGPGLSILRQSFHSFQVLVLLYPWSKIASASWICQFGQFGQFFFTKLRAHSTQTGQGDTMRHKQLIAG